MSLYEDASLMMFPSGYKEDKIYSLKPTDGSGDLNFARASSGTRVNEQGLIETPSVLSTTEEVVNGDFNGNANNWTLQVGWAYDNNNVSKTLNNASYLLQTSILSVGKTYEISFTISNYVGGVFGTNTAFWSTENLYSANGNYTITATTSSANLYLFSDSSFVGSIDNVSVKEVITSNVPRIDYTGGGCGSLLLEPQRTNLITQSEDFSQWSTIGSPTLTSNYGQSPDGLNNSTRVQFSSGDRIYTSASLSGDISYSVYLKGNGTVRMRDNSGAYSNDVTLTNEWVRYDYTFNASISNVQLQQLSGTSDFEIYGAQVEQGSYETSYIPTSGSTVTRLADTSSTTGLSSVINSTEGVLYAEISAFDDQSLNNWISISEDANYNNNQFNLRYFAAINLIQVVSRANGLGQDVVLNYTLTDKTALNKIAIKYKVNDWALWVNGVEVDTETSSIAFTANSLDVLDFNRGNDTNPFYGKCQNLQIYKTALTNTELATLTTL